MKKTVMFIMIICLVIPVIAGNIIPLEELLKPLNMAIDNQQIYITEGITVFIYSLKDFKLIKKFGKEGSGPKEFRRSPFGPGIFVTPHQDTLIINSPGKLSIFSKQGEHIKESPTRMPMNAFLKPFANGYAGFGFTLDQKKQSSSLTLNTYDKNLKKLKELHSQESFSRGRFEYPANNPIFFVVNDRLILPGKDGFEIVTLDAQGNKETLLSRKYKKLPITDNYKASIMHYFKTDPLMSPQFEILKNMIKFPDKFPYIQNLFVVDGKIYIVTYLSQNGKSEFFIYNIKGKFLKRIFLPYGYINPFVPLPTAIKNDKQYQLVENEDTEQWELHVVDIK